MIFLWFSICRR